MESWIQVDKMSGSGDDKVTVTVKRNDGSTDRTTQISVSTSTLDRILIITQKSNKMATIWKINKAGSSIYEVSKDGVSSSFSELYKELESFTGIILDTTDLPNILVMTSGQNPRRINAMHDNTDSFFLVSSPYTTDGSTVLVTIVSIGMDGNCSYTEKKLTVN